ncbi:hypothetical protein GNF76_03330 [Pseudomonas sp. CCM 7893]|uniref:Uncharacterized protein n=1 Tax=Pseudomonas spelaei TaxID=1055469 RepID=A0A6I3VY91_9PSED|nr:hypothetical protein [Pseudomonas spelaei]MUF03350.1 hypothetical protein [Pseudomonas spelaei]QLG91451.1 hypothetical protein HZF02_05555 [Pseudomonas yamanorum]
MISEPGSLLLQHHVRKRGTHALLCRETRLHLSSDQNRLVLSRYMEQYSPQGVRWVERQYSVALEDVLRWLIDQGETSATAISNRSDARRLAS